MPDLLKASLVHEKHISSDSTPPDESLEHVAGTIDSLDGPDTDKSEAERSAIVSTIRYSWCGAGKADNMAGQGAHEEGRCVAHPVAMSGLSVVFPRPDEHWCV